VVGEPTQPASISHRDQPLGSAGVRRASSRARAEARLVQLLPARTQRILPLASSGRPRLAARSPAASEGGEATSASSHDGVLRRILSYRPKTFIQWRVHAVACTILDTGCRIDELLTARIIDFDFDNMLLTVVGKGRKQRKVPFSIELRKLLFRFGQIKERTGVRSDLMFPARDGGKWEHRNARRSYYCLLKNLGLPQTGFHLLRHTFATQYLRHGGMWSGYRSFSCTLRFRPR
jgi:integrase